MAQTDEVPANQKDACQYSIEISKQFITLSTAGAAFSTTVLLSNIHNVPEVPLRSSLVLFAISILLGLLFLMKLMGEIRLNNNYDVYLTSLRWLAVLQMILFLVGIVVVAFSVF